MLVCAVIFICTFVCRKMKKYGKDFLNRFEEKQEQELLRLCTSYGMLEKVLLTTDDINENGRKYVPNTWLML